MMKLKLLARQFQYSILSLALVGFCSYSALAQDGDGQSMMLMPHSMMHSQQNLSGELINIVRQSTERFKDVAVAEAEGYALQFGCVTGPNAGAMGLHFVNFTLVSNTPLTANGQIDPTRPQIVIYEPTPSGRLQLIGADYLILADGWDKAHPGNPPQLMGQLYQYFATPNRFGLPAFYTLHVWAWKNNPNGAFVNWHPNVSCTSFTGQTQ